MVEDSSIVDIALGSQDVTGFFSDLDAFVLIQTQLQSLFTTIQTAKAQTESEKADLALKQNQTVDAKYAVVTQQKQVSADKSQKQQRKLSARMRPRAARDLVCGALSLVALDSIVKR